MLIADQIESQLAKARTHRAGTFQHHVLRRIEQLLPTSVQHSAETGCGKSTILFSNLSAHHTVFCLDDRTAGADSSVRFFEDHELTKRECLQLVLGPTQLTLPTFGDFHTYDVVLIDGPHGYPFPELEYFYLYPHLREGALLILDDVHIPTIGRLGDFVAEDSMFEPVELVGTTAIFRRTAAPTFDPHGDGWWLQQYNRRHVSPRFKALFDEVSLRDGKRRVPYEAHFSLSRSRAFLDRHLLWRFNKR